MTAKVFSLPISQWTLPIGVAAAGAVLSFFENLTSTPLEVFSDEALTISLGTSVEADAAGVWPEIYLQNELYTVTLVDEDGNNLWPSAANDVSGVTTIDGADIAAGSIPLSAIAGGAVFPVGIPFPYAGPVAPAGWFLCYGQAVSRTTYPLLYDALGTTWGVGDGSTTFNVPDFRGRALFGKDNMGGAAANRITNAISGITGSNIAAVGGNESLQSHDHDITDAGHGHGATMYSGGAAFPSSNTYFTDRVGGYVGTGAASGNLGTSTSTVNTNTTGITVNTEGAGSSQNMPPAAIVNWIIQAA